MPRPKWKVHLLGSIEDRGRHYELSVVRQDNSFGQSSWGWGGPDKIILFDSGVGGNDLNPRTEEKIEFAMKVVKSLCDALNKM